MTCGISATYSYTYSYNTPVASRSITITIRRSFSRLDSLKMLAPLLNDNGNYKNISPT